MKAQYQVRVEDCGVEVCRATRPAAGDWAVRDSRYPGNLAAPCVECPPPTASTAPCSTWTWHYLANPCLPVGIETGGQTLQFTYCIQNLR